LLTRDKAYFGVSGFFSSGFGAGLAGGAGFAGGGAGFAAGG